MLPTMLAEMSGFYQDNTHQYIASIFSEDKFAALKCDG